MSLGQKEKNIWYFGLGAGLDFNTGFSTALTNSNMYTNGGSSSISDKNGNLLFYTNGNKVWNKNHQLMSNGTGLISDSISQTTALIVKKPSAQNIYYIFTIDVIPNDLYYSIVDMSLNGGLGNVTSSKNVLLDGNIDGTLLATKKGNCNSYWIITRAANSNQFRAYELTNSGISSSSVNSNVGTINNGRFARSRISQKGDKIAVPIWLNTPFYMSGFPEMYSFNNVTGVVSNPIQLTNIRGLYSFEFSSSGKYLYGTINGVSSSLGDYIYQWDVSTMNATTINNSRIAIDSTIELNAIDLLLGNDNRIYVSIWGPNITSTYRDSLGIIEYPENQGVLCGFKSNGIFLDGRKAGRALPLMYSEVPQKIIVSDSCEQDTASIQLSVLGYYTSHSWDFGDSASGVNNTSSLANPKHKFTDTGYYAIRMIGLDGCFQVDTILDTIYIEPLPSFNIGNDTAICSGDTILLDASFPESSYLWQDSTTDSVYTAFKDSLHYTAVTNGCGTVYDTISITYRNFNNTDLGFDTSVCPGDSLLLDATTPFASHYKWQDNSTDSILLVTSQGIYSVEVGNGCDTLHDSVFIYYITPPAISLGNDTSRCTSDSISLSGKLPAVKYLWYNADTTQSITTPDTGILWLVASNFRCAATDSIHIQIYDSLELELGEDSLLCIGQTIILDATQNVSHTVYYLWNDSSLIATKQVSITGVYKVQVSDYCMTLSDSISILFRDVPIVNLGLDSTICFGDNITLDGGADGDTYLWFDNSTSQTNTVNNPGKYWVRVENICGVNSDTIVISIRHAPNVFLGNDTTLCLDKTMTLDAYAEDASYLWQDGATGRYYLVSKEGEYWVKVTNVCNQDNDSILALYIDKPMVDLGNDTTICLEENLTLDARAEQASYLWNDGRKDSIRTIREGGYYSVVSTNLCGEDEDDINIEVNDCQCRLYIPNSFTPNGDGINDVFHMEAACEINKFSIRIYNRWGESIFESDTKNFEWDGKYNSIDIPIDDYTYHINIEYLSNNRTLEKTVSGRIMLMR